MKIFQMHSLSIFRLLFFVVLIFTIDSNAIAQKQVAASSSEILHTMKRLNVLGTVMYIAAHPDDENTRLLAYMARDRNYKTAYLAMTRGDGGQNLIGDEQGIELGMIRTQELLAARRVDGAEQFFTRAYDFGFSKRTEEALAIWDKQKVLADAVWVIRNFKPDVIITRFPEDSRAGHGHHSGSAVIAREAFVAAADPKMFPEQFKFGVGPWKARRIMWNTFSFGSSNTTAENQLKIDAGSYIPLLGKSIGEIAAEGRSQHRSQGFGSASTRGSATEYFIHTLGEKAEKDPMDGIDCSWSRVEGGSVVNALVNQLVESYSVHDPSASLQQLIAIRKAINAIGDAHWKRIKLGEVDRIIQLASGLHLEALADRSLVKQGDSIRVNVLLNNRAGAEINIGEISFENTKAGQGMGLKKNVNWTNSFYAPVPSTKKISQPYWLEKTMDAGYFNVDDQRLIGMPENKPAFTVLASLNVMGETIPFEIPVRYRVVDPAKGEFFHPVYVVPATPAADKKMETISYEHIPSLTYFSNLVKFDLPKNLKTTGKRIGYITGAGDKLPDMIRMMGFDVTELGRSDINQGKLNQFDAVVVGVRAYNVNEWMAEKHAILMDYVSNGGNLVVQYNTNSFAGPMQKTMIGPKPFSISRGRTTEEDADVVFLDENDPLLNFPNKITKDDFSGWIQERGIYYAENFSTDYKAVLSMHDKGEADLNGSLIVRNEGKGRFIYTGLVFFRELPAGVPGAFRLFANIISNPNKKINGTK
ncbi:MAG: PIG-L family deacetylase [Chitinophagaceae bacterium]|nr:PIG-L family deacetylase [Chitinophagaceae bacterium]